MNRFERVCENYNTAHNNGTLCVDSFDTDYGELSLYNRCDSRDIEVARRVVTYAKRSGKYVTGLPYDVFRMYYNPRAVWLDAGSHIGGFSMRWAIQFGVAKIYSYEALYGNYTFLAHNVKLNKLQDIVVPYQAAIVVDDIENVILYVGGILERPSTGVHTITPTRRGEKIVVPAANIDHVIDMYDIDHVKLHIEGIEYDVLLQSERILDMKMLAIEYHFSRIRDVAGFPKYWEVIDALKSKYNYVRHLEKPNKPWHCTIVACNR